MEFRLVRLRQFAPESVHIALLFLKHEAQRVDTLTLQLPQLLVL
jgi:hypothetical protein